MNYYMRSYNTSIATNEYFYMGSYFHKLKFKPLLLMLHTIHLDVCGYNCFNYSFSPITFQDDLRMNEVHNCIKNNKWEI